MTDRLIVRRGYLGASKPKGLNRIDKVGQGHLFLGNIVLSFHK